MHLVSIEVCEPFRRLTRRRRTSNRPQPNMTRKFPFSGGWGVGGYRENDVHDSRICHLLDPAISRLQTPKAISSPSSKALSVQEAFKDRKRRKFFTGLGNESGAENTTRLFIPGSVLRSVITKSGPLFDIAGGHGPGHGRVTWEARRVVEFEAQ
ncbi:hypothetical protein FA13DRAFT_1783540 [Coprinellus micaceus]|uniref:Uncharacterized protein n=1 Tax=Coprinellus micaceus TaxID=71717 RepID=A0A4Y7RJ57_COPMI|nr:hypothetical protein FA13DRAFT_1783540 [Coprinellus micaceus]